MDLTATSILEIGALLLAAAGAGWLARRVGLPAVLGYLAVGLLLSPFTPGYVADREQLQLLADLGVVLLLFEVGIEIDLGRIRRERRQLLWTAPLQVLITLGVSAGAFVIAGIDPLPAAILGLAVALSSSVVIMNMTRSRRRTTDSATEHALLGWSVIQDTVGVALAAFLLAALGVSGRPLPETVVGIVGYAAVAVIVAALLPRVLRVVRGESDIFLLVSVSVGLVLAGVGSAIFGVPLALAAFVAGLAISESPETAEARRRLIPFRDLFAVLFFVTIGALVDPGRILPGLPWLARVLALVVVAKVGVAWALARLAALDARPRQVAIGLGQMGEFSFVLAAAAASVGAIPRDLYMAVIVAVAVSIAASTVAIRLAGPARTPLVTKPEAA